MHRAFSQIALLEKSRALGMLLALFIAPELSFAAEASESLDLTQHWAGYSALFIFVMAYGIVILEERLHLRKSKPVIVAAGIIWALVAAAEVQNGTPGAAGEALRHNLLEFVELFLFLLAAMTYINTMAERRVFEVLRAWLVSQGFSLRTIFWLTGLLAFFISPIADNLTTALLMATVVMAVGGSNHHFVVVACTNVVVAANAGGAFSPFGDITTLMVWQKGIVEFQEFFVLFLPSVVNWLVPAAFMAFAVPKARPPALDEHVALKNGAWIVVGLFIVTITMAVSFHNFLHLPPVLGMMTGLGLLKFFGYYLKRRDQATLSPLTQWDGKKVQNGGQPQPVAKPFNIFEQLERAEWDTLMFFYGIILCVGGLGAIGYLALGSQFMYVDLGPTTANILVGILSAIVDNIPVMFAVLSMEPDMGHGQWLLVTLTAGVGGSLLSIGSAAGVAVMGQARGVYTFFAHLKWIWAIALGYGASIWVHLTLNAELFQ
ncbi:sodium/proton antiporter, NhaD family [Nitrosococcus oceani ATCC 19707]|uniref:Sodium/proton antiporter, NhaD family n=2 Tax=Nitrosococcus oceani TaxID=1229 RepID=Q3JB18_NITOC|nr:sodium:proton antiporter NhaD [Nitrosococcus oceani]ABA57978.1 sodium/proton antiporter, NhaD family [Nitrosococcus oceani ATCC 19707]EDZ68176.1 Citrate transporter superfamily [Nitrosococcus oceani AFC27]KFI19708.1 sodium:proton antiporter [Nitrosococcus oceani C-27]GEM19625.1 sodium:proton antiporter [Nitrosococcus oceani]